MARRGEKDQDATVNQNLLQSNWSCLESKTNTAKDGYIIWLRDEGIPILLR